MAVDLSASISSPTGFTLDNGTLAGKGTTAQAAELLRLSGIGSSMALPDVNSALRGAAPSGHTMTSAPVTSGRLYLIPIAFGMPTVTEIGIVVITAGAAGTKVRVGIYDRRSGGMGPGALLVDSGELATNSTGHKAAAISQAVVVGRIYWMAALFSGTPSVKMTSAPAGWQVGVDNTTQTNATNYANQIYRVFSYGALPSDESSQTTYTYDATTNLAPIILWK